MDERLVWRLRLHRWGAVHERGLRVAMGCGFVGMALMLGLRSLAPQMWPGWQLLGLGLSLVLAGAGHALLGEGSSLGAYARGESEEMPALGKLASGLLASGGGMVIALTGLVQMAG